MKKTTAPIILPGYIKVTSNLITLTLVLALVFIANDIIMPILFAILISILLLPANELLERWGLPRLVAIIVTLGLTACILFLLLYFLSFQISNFANDIPALTENVNGHIKTLQEWIKTTFNINYKNQLAYITEATDKTIQSGSAIVGQTFLRISGILVFLVLVPIYCFFILLYRSTIKAFLTALFAKESNWRMHKVLSETKFIVQNYMVGLLLDMLIVASLNSIGFLVLGIKYAILLGVIAALLNLIPYIGMIIASLLCMLVTLTTSDSLTTVAFVMVVLLAVQFIDNNILMPNIVGSKVRINALITIIGVVIGGFVAGVAGMFISIPAIAIMKVIFDNSRSMKPWGILLGDD